MNGYQRIRAVLNGEWPDKRPVMLHNFMMAACEAGMTMKEYRKNPDKAAKAFIQAVEEKVNELLCFNQKLKQKRLMIVLEKWITYFYVSIISTRILLVQNW